MAGEVGWRPWTPQLGATVPGLASVIGHRGAAAVAPENTLAALRAAHAACCRWVEFDVMLSQDGVPVLIHDETVDRTTDGTGRVPELTFAALRALDAGRRRDPRFAGERIPSLEEAITLCLELGLAANVEIKPATGHAPETGRAVASMLAELWPRTGPRLLLSSFEREALAAARDLAPHLPRGLLADALPPDWQAALAGLGCTTLNLDHERVTEEEIALLARRGVPVLLYTVNRPELAKRLLAAGAAAVFTDAPGELLAALG